MTIKKRAAAATTALLLLFAGCSNLDDTTDLGSGFVKNHSDFDVKEFEKPGQMILESGSFQDGTDSLVPSITYNSDLSTGRFANMRTISYLEFSNKELYQLLTDIITEKGSLESFKLKFELDTTKSSTNDAFIELGTSYLSNHLDKFDENDMRNKEIAYAHSSSFLDSTTTISFDLDTSFFHFAFTYDSIKTDSIIDTVFSTNFKDTNTSFNVTGIKYTTKIQAFDSTKNIDTVTITEYNSLSQAAIEYSYGHDASKTLIYHISDTIYSILADQSLDTNYVKDSTAVIQQVVTYLKSTYDTITIDEEKAYDDTISYEYLSNLYGNINYILSDTIKSSGSTVSEYDSITIDTIYFKPLLKIIDSDISTIKNSNGITTFDTNYIYTEMYENYTVTKTTDIVLKDIGLTEKLNDTSFWFIDTIYKDNDISKPIISIDTLKQFTFYLKQISDKNNSLQFYKNPRIEVSYLKADGIETGIKSLIPGYKSYTIYEDGDEATLANKAIINGAADRMMRLKLDVSQLWENMRDSGDTAIIYQNIPKLDVTVKMDSAIYHHESSARKSDSSNYYTYFYYKASDTAITTIWDPSLNDGVGGQISRSKCDTVWLDDINDNSGNIVTFEIDQYVQDILNNCEMYNKPIPNDIYLTVWLYDNSFTEVLFDTTSFDMDFIISNLKEDDE